MNIPVSAEWVLGALLGIQLICEGAALAYLAWQVRTAKSEPPASQARLEGGDI